MDNPVTRMLTSIGATALLFVTLDAFGIQLPLWAMLTSGFLVGVILGIGDLVAKRKNQRRS